MSLFDLITGSRLPINFRGYERKATDELLRAVEASYRSVVVERDECRTRMEAAEQRVAELERELAHHRAQSQAISDALVRAVRAKTESEEEAQSIKDDAQREASALRARAEREAETVVREALARAETLIQDAELGVKKRAARTEELLDESRERLALFVRDLLDRVSNGALDADTPDTGPQGSGSPAEETAPRRRP